MTISSTINNPVFLYFCFETNEDSEIVSQVLHRKCDENQIVRPTKSTNHSFEFVVIVKDMKIDRHCLTITLTAKEGKFKDIEGKKQKTVCKEVLIEKDIIESVSSLKLFFENLV